MLVISKNADIKQLQLVDQYVIDTFPAADKENQEVTEKMIANRDRLQATVLKHLEKLEAQKERAKE